MKLMVSLPTCVQHVAPLAGREGNFEFLLLMTVRFVFFGVESFPKRKLGGVHTWSLGISFLSFFLKIK